MVQATLWRDSKDTQPAVSNIAFGSRETYMPNMKKWYVEDTASSSLGRAIIILKGSNKTATKDSMKVVEADEKQNEYEKKLAQRRYGAPGSKSAAVEDALRASFAVDNKLSYISYAPSMPAPSFKVIKCSASATIFISMPQVFNMRIYLLLRAKVSIPSRTHLTKAIVRSIASFVIPSTLFIN